jgi:hypothetical protein
MRRPGWIAILLVALGSGAPAQSSDEGLGPPLYGPLIPSSSFGEYRSGHYHGGLDFSTGGREGAPVLAPRVGSIYRVRASGIGYGRSVYFRLDDGRTVVFAHLSRFEPRLAAFVDAAQDRQGTYEVDLYPEPNAFRYGSGDTLAYSGQSGAGPPHLHAEVRTGKDASLSLNPWRAGWAPADSLPPRIAGLRVEPAEPGVLVNEGLDPVLLTIDPRKPAPSLRVTGPVRLWVKTWDPMPTGARMAPYRVSARIGDEVVEEIVFDAVDWNSAREVNWTYHAPSARRGEDVWIALEPAPAGRQHLARTRKHWEEDLETGPHPLTLEVEDGAGNESKAVIALAKDAPPTLIPSGVIGRPSLLSRGAFLEIKLPGPSPTLRIQDERGRSEEPDMLRLSMRGGTVFQIGHPDHPGTWSFFSQDSLLGRAFWLSGNEGKLLWPGRDDSVVVAVASNARVGMRLGTSYGPLWVLARTAAMPRLAGGELEPATPVLELQPWAMPLRQDAVVGFLIPGPRDRRRLAVMRRDSEGWSFVGADTTGEGVAGRVGSLETVAVFRDRTPPRITILPVTGGRRARLRAALRDNGVGLAIGGLRFVLDGKNVISEWDADAGILIGHLREPLAPGRHELALEAVDRVGNFARAYRTFTVH